MRTTHLYRLFCSKSKLWRWITVVVDRWWWKAGMSGGRGESGGRGRDGGAVVKERWQRKRRLWPWIQTYFHYLRINEQVQFELYYMYVYTMDDSVWTRMKTTVDWPVF
ncbi:unnamed protein product [Brassica oleracea var. botrytis]